MNRVLIISADANDETNRIAKALTDRGATRIVLRADSPVSVLIDTLKLRKKLQNASVIHAFGGTALAAATIASGVPIIFTPTTRPTRTLTSWCRAIAAYRSLDIVCTNDTIRRAIVTRGFDFDRTHLIRPGVNLASVPTTRDNDLRLGFGFSNADTVLFCPLEITPQSGHAAAVWALSILNVVHPQYKLLLWGSGTAVSRVRELVGRTLNPGIYHIADTCNVASVFAAADAILLTPAGYVPMLPIAMSMASGKPIVATVTQQICELLEDRHTALLVNSTTPRAIAHRIVDLMSDATLAWKLKDRARAEVYDHLTQSKMLELHRQLYEKVSGSQNETSSPSFLKPSEA